MCVIIERLRGIDNRVLFVIDAARLSDIGATKDILGLVAMSAFYPKRKFLHLDRNAEPIAGEICRLTELERLPAATFADGLLDRTGRERSKTVEFQRLDLHHMCEVKSRASDWKPIDARSVE